MENCEKLWEWRVDTQNHSERVLFDSEKNDKIGKRFEFFICIT